MNQGRKEDHWVQVDEARKGRHPAVPDGGPCGGPPNRGADPKKGARFTGFLWKVGRVNMAGDPVCTLVCGNAQVKAWAKEPIGLTGLQT